MRIMLVFFFLSFSCAIGNSALASESSSKKTLTHQLSSELQYFFAEGVYGQDQTNLALFFSSEYFWQSSKKNLSFTFLPYMRIEQQWTYDSASEYSKRTHVDLREAYWRLDSDRWELKAGVTRVFWGKTEFVHLVDVINQLDTRESKIDEEKLGQPMINASFLIGEGTLDLFMLMGFRERTYASKDGRLRLPFLVETDLAVLDETPVDNVDFAVRWDQPLGEYLDVAVSHFVGLSRIPTLILNVDINQFSINFVPYYEFIEQTGLELEAISNGWTYKLEAISVEGKNSGRWGAYTAGIEYTWGDVFSSGNDFTGVFEYMYDNRDEIAPTFLEDDFGVAIRWSANDLHNSQGTLGVIFDPATEETIIRLDFNRRFGDEWKLIVEMVAFESKGNFLVEKIYYLQQDDFFRLQIVRYL
jgi:hypothetical protein